LLDNALAHTPAGGHIRVVVARTADGGTVRCVVEDDGEGFPPADNEVIFERFARGGHGDRRRFGLGLALVREVVEAHGGSVRAAGRQGAGATFTLILPAWPEDE
jgi:signal transduction histidine kinase